MESELARATPIARREEEEEGREKEVVVVKTEVREHPVLEELRTLNVEQISPIEALNLLYELKKKAEGSSS
jgi:DNA mismatch repair protein MutS